MSLYFLSTCNYTAFHFYSMHMQITMFFSVKYTHSGIFIFQYTSITNLSARFSIKWSCI